MARSIITTPAEPGQALVPARGSRKAGVSAQAISTLYYTIASQRVQDRSVVLQFVSARPGEGTSLVTQRFVAFAAQAEGGSALLITCGQPAPGQVGNAGSGPKLGAAGLGAAGLGATGTKPSLLAAYTAEGRIASAMTELETLPGLHVARLDDGLRPNQATLAGIYEAARATYQFTALDTPSIEESASTLTFARHADGVVLVLEAEATPASVAESALEQLERAGGKVLGMVFNKRRRRLPRWLFRKL